MRPIVSFVESSVVLSALPKRSSEINIFAFIQNLLCFWSLALQGCNINVALHLSGNNVEFISWFVEEYFHHIEETSKLYWHSQNTPFRGYLPLHRLHI
jgi:hypothetical protein